MKHCLFILAAACFACAGCFDNHSRPADVVTVTSLDALAAKFDLKKLLDGTDYEKLCRAVEDVVNR